MLRYFTQDNYHRSYGCLKCQFSVYHYDVYEYVCCVHVYSLVIRLILFALLQVNFMSLVVIQLNVANERLRK